ncbi:MAG: hypothetical protein AAGK28_09930 [Pseudomonadota bacterium]
MANGTAARQAGSDIYSLSDAQSIFEFDTCPQRALLFTTIAARNGPLMRALSATAIPNQPLVLAVIVAAMLVEILLLTALNQILLKLRPER